MRLFFFSFFLSLLFFCFFGPFFRLFCPFCPSSVVPTHTQKRERERERDARNTQQERKRCCSVLFFPDARDEKKNTKSVVSRAPFSKSKLFHWSPIWYYIFSSHRVVRSSTRGGIKDTSRQRESSLPSTRVQRRRFFVGGGGRGVAKAPPPRLVKEERVDAATFFERSLSDEKECALFFRGVGLVFKKAVINCGRE